jgi:DNA polymerase-3 subunit alpha
MAALMTSDFDDTDRLAIEITECKHMGLTVLPPDVNESFVEFAVVKQPQTAIRFGMAAIKNVGTGAVEAIVEARRDGEFASLEDFMSRVNVSVVNRKALESLVKAGAFDRYGERATILHNMDAIVSYGQRLHKQKQLGQTDLFGSVVEGQAKPDLHLAPPELPPSPREMLSWERELLGIFLTQQPLQAFSTLLAEQTVPLSTLLSDHDGKAVTVGGSIADFREITTKNGQKMAFVRIEDEFGDTELILFPSIYQQTIGLWERDRVIIARGKVNARDREGNTITDIKILVDDAREVTHEQAAAYQATGKKPRAPKASKRSVTIKKSSQANPTKLYLRVDSSDNTEQLRAIKQTIDANPGPLSVVLVIGTGDAKQAIRLPGSVDSASAQHFSEIVGPANVKAL